MLNIREELLTVMRLGFNNPKLGLEYAPHYEDQDELFTMDKKRSIYSRPIGSLTSNEDSKIEDKEVEKTQESTLDDPKDFPPHFDPSTIVSKKVDAEIEFANSTDYYLHIIRQFTEEQNEKILPDSLDLQIGTRRRSTLKGEIKSMDPGID